MEDFVFVSYLFDPGIIWGPSKHQQSILSIPNSTLYTIYELLLLGIPTSWVPENHVKISGKHAVFPGTLTTLTGQVFGFLVSGKTCQGVLRRVHPLRFAHPPRPARWHVDFFEVGLSWIQCVAPTAPETKIQIHVKAFETLEIFTRHWASGSEALGSRQGDFDP